MADTRCARRGALWWMRRLTAIPPITRSDGMKLTHPGVFCKDCGISWDEVNPIDRCAM